VGQKIPDPNPPAAADVDQASSEGGGHEPPAGDGAMRRPEADSNSEFRIPNSGIRFFSPKLMSFLLQTGESTKAYRIAMQGAEDNPFSAHHLLQNSAKSEYTRKTILNSSI